jgi:hypothetical protein
MNREIDHLDEPLLEFGYGQRLKDPKDGLFLFGPLEDRRPAEMRVGIIGTPKGIAVYRQWLDRARAFIPLADPEVKHRLAYPGFEAIFQTKWPTKPVAEIGVSANEIFNAIRKTDRHKAIYDTVSLFSRPIIKKLIEDDVQVDVWFVIIPDEVWRLGRPLSRPSKLEGLHDPDALGPKLGKRLLREPSLFAEDKLASEPYRYDVNFHHQLKARLLANKVVVQVVRESSLSSAEDDEVSGGRRGIQDPASLAWNLTTTAFFKAGGRPWKLAEVRPGVCYIGLVFKINTLDPTAGNACCGAQMFLDSGDGLVFKSTGSWYSQDRKEFSLAQEGARELISRVVGAYTDLHGKPPLEIFVHGRKRFSFEEWCGFKEGAPGSNIVCVRISRSQEMKLYRPTKTPIMRGSAYRLEQNRSLLWTAGYIPELATYPGREVPNPLLVEISRGDGDMSTILRDVMGLTKVNFNACIFSDGLPVTLRFAEAVGEILTAAPHSDGPPLPFRHYI